MGRISCPNECIDITGTAEYANKANNTYRFEFPRSSGDEYCIFAKMPSTYSTDVKYDGCATVMVAAAGDQRPHPSGIWMIELGRRYADWKDGFQVTCISPERNQYPVEFGYFVEDDWVYVGVLKRHYSGNTSVSVLSQMGTVEIYKGEVYSAATPPEGWTPISIRTLVDQSMMKSFAVQKIYLGTLTTSAEKYQEFASCRLRTSKNGLANHQQFACMITGIDIYHTISALVQWRGHYESDTDKQYISSLVSIFRLADDVAGVWDIGYYIDDDQTAHFMIHTAGFFRGMATIEILNGNYPELLSDRIDDYPVPIFEVKPSVTEEPEGYTPFNMKYVAYES